MLNIETFKNLDKEFQNSLVDFVYEEMLEKSKNDINKKSTMKNFSIFYSKKYCEIIEEGNLNEEKYSDEIINYMAKCRI